MSYLLSTLPRRKVLIFYSFDKSPCLLEIKKNRFSHDFSLNVFSAHAVAVGVQWTVLHGGSKAAVSLIEHRGLFSALMNQPVSANRKSIRRLSHAKAGSFCDGLNLGSTQMTDSFLRVPIAYSSRLTFD